MLRNTGRSEETATAGILVALVELNGGARCGPDDARGLVTVKGTGSRAVQN